MTDMLIQDVFGATLIPWLIYFLVGCAVAWCLAIAVDDWLLNKLGRKK